MVIYAGVSPTCGDYCYDVWVWDFATQLWYTDYAFSTGIQNEFYNSSAGPLNRWQASALEHNNMMIIYAGTVLPCPPVSTSASDCSDSDTIANSILFNSMTPQVIACTHFLTTCGSSTCSRSSGHAFFQQMVRPCPDLARARQRASIWTDSSCLEVFL